MTSTVDLLVHHLVAAFPGRAIIAILPQAATSDLPQAPLAPVEAPQPTLPARGSNVSHDPGVTASPTSESRAPRPKGKRSLAVKAQEVLYDEGDVCLSREEWAARLGPGTGRLVDRVIRHGAVPTTNKGSTKGHRARQVLASDMVTALETIEGVKAGKMTPPAWYDDVARAA